MPNPSVPRTVRQRQHDDFRTTGFHTMLGNEVLWDVVLERHALLPTDRETCGGLTKISPTRSELIDLHGLGHSFARHLRKSLHHTFRKLITHVRGE